MWVKICGVGHAEAVSAALQGGADAIGFVFAASVRRIEPAAAARLAAAARGRCQLVAVTVHPSQALIDEILATLRPDALQSDWADFASLRLPQSLVRLPVLRAAPSGSSSAALPARLLYEGARSGSGSIANWNEARQLAARSELILAGGLSAGNVGQAIERVRPFGVDVSSGVESSPGCKDPALIAQFIEAARAVAQDVA